MKNKKLLNIIKEHPYIPLYMKECQFYERKHKFKFIKSNKRHSENHPFIPIFKPKKLIFNDQ